MLKLQTINKLSTAQEIRDQTLQEAQEISTALIAAEQRIGELLLAIPKQAGGVNQYNKEEKSTRVEKSKSEVVSEMGYSRDEASDYQRMAQNPEVVQRVIETALAKGDVVTKTAVMKEIKASDERQKALEQRIQELESREAEVKIVKTVPADYEILKKRAKEADAWRRDYQNLQDKRTRELAQVRELEKELKELKSTTTQGIDTENLSQNIYYFCTMANNFIGNVGGLVWLTDRIADMPEKEKGLFLKAAYSFRDWALAFTANLEKGMENGSNNNNDK